MDYQEDILHRIARVLFLDSESPKHTPDELEVIRVDRLDALRHCA